MNYKPYWYKLLYHFEHKRYFQNGLTLPFIIGSKLFIEPNNKLEEISDLIHSMNNSPYKIVVLECWQIGVLVFRLSADEDSYIFKKIDNLIIIDNSFLNAKSSSDIIQELNNKYSNIIATEKYSRTEGEWGAFTITDKIRLKEII